MWTAVTAGRGSSGLFLLIALVMAVLVAAVAWRWPLRRSLLAVREVQGEDPEEGSDREAEGSGRE